MNSSVPMLTTLFVHMLGASLAASAVIVSLLLLRPLLRRFLPPRWLYLLWLIAVARLLMVEIPSPTMTPAALLPDPVETIARTVVPLPASVVQTGETTATIPATPAFSWILVLPWIWLSGVAAMLIFSFYTSARWKRLLHRAQSVADPAMMGLLEESQILFQLHRPVEVVQLSGLGSPCITGLLRHTLVLPADYAERFSREELHWIVLHELAHIKRGDMMIHALCCLVQAVHWFNPLVWIGFSCMRHDRELACDASVLDLQAQRESNDYGRTLLKVAEIYPGSPWTPGFLGIMEENSNLKDRIIRIMNYKPVTATMFLTALFLCAGLTYVFLGNSGRPPKETMPTKPEAPPAPANAVVAPAIPPIEYYRVEFRVLIVPTTLQSELEAFNKSGDPLEILRSPGVKVFASPVANSSSSNACELSSHQQVPVVTSSPNGAETSHSVSYANTGWKLQFTVFPSSSDLTHLLAIFDIEGLLVYNESKGAPSYPPQTSSGHLPYDGVVPLNKYYLLGTIDMTSNSSTDPTLNSPTMLALIVKLEKASNPQGQ